MINLLYDATILVNGCENKGDRSGIYFTAQNILDQLLLRDDVEVTLFVEINKIGGLRKLSRYKAVPCFATCSKFKVFLYELTTFFRKKRIEFINQPLTRKFFASIALGLEILNGAINIPLILKLKNCGYNAFFSPLTAAPWYIQKNEKIKKFTFIHDAIPYRLEEYKVQRKGEWFGHLIASLNSKDFYFANSYATKNDFCDLFKVLSPSQIKVTYLAASERFRLYSDKSRLAALLEKYHIPVKKFVFSLCTLEPRKNLIRVVKTFISFLEKNRIDDLYFVLGGGSWVSFMKEIEHQVPNFEKFKEKILWTGYIDDDDVPVFYSFAEWFVYTSQYEGFGLPLLEAMQCGCPVIGANSTSLPEVVGDAGILIDWDSDEQHVAAYEKYYFNENLRKENSRKGLERAKLFSWEKTVDQMVRVMKENMRT